MNIYQSMTANTRHNAGLTKSAGSGEQTLRAPQKLEITRPPTQSEREHSMREATSHHRFPQSFAPATYNSKISRLAYVCTQSRGGPCVTTVRLGEETRAHLPHPLACVLSRDLQQWMRITTVLMSPSCFSIVLLLRHTVIQRTKNRD